jgi:hypothetical protein
VLCEFFVDLSFTGDRRSKVKIWLREIFPSELPGRQSSSAAMRLVIAGIAARRSRYDAILTPRYLKAGYRLQTTSAMNAAWNGDRRRFFNQSSDFA